jgi:uncharacterized membrane protein
MTAHRDLNAAAAAALVAAALVAVPFEPVRIVGALPLALLLPGYAITAATFAGRRIPGAQLLLLTLALSLSTLALGSLLLNAPSEGLTRLSWTVFLVVVVLAGCAIAARRRTAPANGAMRIVRPQLGIAQVALAAGGVLALVAAFWLALTVLPAKDAIGYTRLWMLPGPGAGRTVRIGVQSEEQHALSYELKVTVGNRRVAISPRFLLRPGHGRGFKIAIKPARNGASTPVTARLYRKNDPGTVYRRVTGWIPAA